MVMEVSAPTAPMKARRTSRTTARPRHAVRRLGFGVEASKAKQQRQIDDVRAAERRLLEAHLARFPVAQRPLIPAPAAADEEQIQRQQTERLLTEVSRFNRAGRAAARAEAVRNADAQVARLRMARLDSLERAQAYADDSWELLTSHDPEAVRGVLASAYEANSFATRVLEVWRDAAVQGVTVVVFFKAIDAMPPMTVVEATDGTAQLQEQRARHAWYLRAMGSTVLATVRQTLAACPSVDAVSVLVVRDDKDDPTAVALFAGQLDRGGATRPCPWDADPARALLDGAGGLLRLAGADHEVRPLDPRELPGLSDLLSALPTPR